MKFIVSSSHLLKQLQILGSIINNNNTLHILDNFLFELKQNELKVVSSDLETTMIAKIEVESDSEGSIAVPAKYLLDTLKTFSDQPLTFNVNEGESKITISSSFGEYNLAYLPGEEYPKPEELEDTTSIAISAEVLSTAINKTIFAAGNDDLRPIMSGVLFEFSPKGIVFVATDAHKLVKYSREDITSANEASFVMPKKPLNVLKNIIASSNSDIEINYNETNAMFSFDNFVLVCRLIDGKYPNYEAVIPKENPNVMVISRTQLLNSSRRVAIFANKSTHQIRLKIIGSELNISAEDVYTSSKAEERLTCNYNGDDIQIGFNSKFLIEMLNNLQSDDVQLEMSVPNRAGILTPVDGLDEGEKVTMIVMPVMLND